jgi:hypothetical protein
MGLFYEIDCIVKKREKQKKTREKKTRERKTIKRKGIKISEKKYI